MKKVNGIDTDEARIPKLLLIGLPCLIIALWVGAWIALPMIYKRPDSAGTFGDMFGSINALFSGLALVGVILAIVLQSKELDLQRKEIRGQREQLEKQASTSHQQRLETTFFQLLRKQGELTEALVHPGNPSITGKACFPKFIKALRRKYDDRARASSGQERDWIRTQAITEFWEENQSVLGSYMRTFEVTCMFLANQLHAEDFYTELLIAQITDDEAWLLLAYSKSAISSATFREAVEILDIQTLVSARIIVTVPESLLSVFVFPE